MKMYSRIVLLLATSLALLHCSKDDGPTPLAPEPENLAPGAFTLLQVEDNATDVDVLPTFSWNVATDPDGDTVTYDLYLGQETDPATKIASDLGTASFDLTERLSLLEGYYWKVAAKDGKGKEVQSSTFGFTTRNLKTPDTPITSNAPFSARASHATVVFDNKIWVIGGYSGGVKNDVWNSNDGVNWTEVTTNAAFSARSGHTTVVFDNKLWLVGGLDVSGSKNDVWSSSDGINWTEVTFNADFSPRRGHTVVVFDNKLWVIGGVGLTNFNDVWSSSDGNIWTEVTFNAAFSERGRHATTVFNDKLWVIGGYDDMGYKNDVWSSSDGINWVEVTLNADFSARSSHTTTMFDDKLWIIGGQADGFFNTINDVWSSKDGVNWMQVTVNGDFSDRAGHTTTVFGDKLWVIGGYYGKVGSLSDVWSFE